MSELEVVSTALKWRVERKGDGKRRFLNELALNEGEKAYTRAWDVVKGTPENVK